MADRQTFLLVAKISITGRTPDKHQLLESKNRIYQELKPNNRYHKLEAIEEVHLPIRRL